MHGTDKMGTSRRTWLRSAAVIGVVVGSIALMGQYADVSEIWWEPGTARSMPPVTTFQDATGELMVYNTEGPIPTEHNAFFENMGSNGRACVTCHQPSNAMSLSTSRLHERWEATKGADPVFAAVDGSNCPTLPQKEMDSHSLLLNRGLFRIYLPWPAPGVMPEFTIEVVHDPSGCNTDTVYGMKSAHPAISVYRRPRVVANLRYVLGSDDAFDPEKPFAGALAADGRDTTLLQQASDAMRAHEEKQGSLTAAQLAQILAFESQVFVAQSTDIHAGDLAEVDGPKALGAWNMERGQVVAGVSSEPVFLDIGDWKSPWNRDQSAFRASVVRGSELFESRRFVMKDVAGVKTGTVGTCATCHTSSMAGSNREQKAMDVGTTMQAHEDAFGAAAANDLPLFKVTCHAGAAPHPYLGRVIYTTDPGRALTTGKCADVGSIVMQQFRGLSARAPYFSNGSAKTLGDVVDFYDRRFAMRLTPQEKSDLVNFLGVL